MKSWQLGGNGSRYVILRTLADHCGTAVNLHLEFSVTVFGAKASGDMETVFSDEVLMHEFLTLATILSGRFR